MPFDIHNLNPGERFELPSGEGVFLRPPNVEFLDSIKSQTTVKKVEHVQPKKKSGKPDRRQPLQRIEYEEVDETKEEELIFDYMIVDWDIKTPGGEDIPCTTENKVKLMRESLEFNKFVTENCDYLFKEEEARERELEKN